MIHDPCSAERKSRLINFFSRPTSSLLFFHFIIRYGLTSNFLLDLENNDVHLFKRQFFHTGTRRASDVPKRSESSQRVFIIGNEERPFKVIRLVLRCSARLWRVCRCFRAFFLLFEFSPNSHAVITLFLLCCVVRQDSDSCAKISSLAKFNERRTI